MTKRIGLAGPVVALALGITLAAGQAAVDTVAVKWDESPEASFAYRRFYRRVAVGDATDAAVSFFAKASGSGLVTGRKKGFFKDDPDNPGSTVVLSGDIGPDSRLFRRFGYPAMNTGGDVAFDARLSGGGAGVFREGPSVVALLGDAVPGVTGLLDGFSGTVITDGGDVIFRATISGAAEVDGVKLDEGIVRCTGGDRNCSSGTGSFEILVVKNESVPDRAEREFCGFEEVAASNFGIAFLALTKENCADGNEFTRRGIFRLPFGGSVVTVALEGGAAEPFPDPGGTTYGLIMGAPDVANDGAVVFKARTTGSLVNYVLYLCAPALCPAARAEAGVIQGSVDPAGNAFTRFGVPVVSDAGDMAFKATVRGSEGRGRGLYVRRADGTLETVVLKGELVTGLAPAAEFKRFAERIGMSSGGRIGFRAKVRRVLSPRKSLEGVFVADIGGSPSGAFLDVTTGVLD
jgi:hypothetical protein